MKTVAADESPRIPQCTGIWVSVLDGAPGGVNRGVKTMLGRIGVMHMREPLGVHLRQFSGFDEGRFS